MSLGGSGVQGDVAITRNTDGRLEVLVVGNDNSLWHKWQTAAGSSDMDRLDIIRWYWYKGQSSCCNKLRWKT